MESEPAFSDPKSDDLSENTQNPGVFVPNAFLTETRGSGFIRFVSYRKIEDVVIEPLPDGLFQGWNNILDRRLLPSDPRSKSPYFITAAASILLPLPRYLLPVVSL